MQAEPQDSPVEVHEVLITLEQIPGEPSTPRHVEAKKNLAKVMARDSGAWSSHHSRHRLLDALYGYSKYYERQKIELDRFKGLYKSVTKAQKSVSLSTRVNLFTCRHHTAART